MLRIFRRTQPVQIRSRISRLGTRCQNRRLALSITMNKMRNDFLQVQWLLFFIISLLLFPTSSFAAPSQEVVDKCMKAVDFQGCIRALSDGQRSLGPGNNSPNSSTPSIVNACPPGYGYRGSGHCQNVRCTNIISEDSVVLDRFDIALQGKGWECKRPSFCIFCNMKPFFDGPLVPATHNKKCPNEEPEFGRESSCGNGQAEK
jgi:hypothetical protein